MSTGAYDVVVTGGGANGLTAAATLGRAGRRVLLVEGDAELGGQARVIEFAPGFRVAPLGQDPGWIPEPVARALGLNGLERLAPDPGIAVLVDGTYLTLPRDAARAADAIRVHSPSDAAKWPEFTSRLRKLAGFLETLYTTPAPDISASSLGELLPLLSVGRKFRALGRRDMVEFLRTLPLSAWELADDWFECAPLKAAIAAAGVQHHQQGPRSGGTGFVLLHHLIGAPAGALRARSPWRSGPDAFAKAAEAAARRHGVEIRTQARVGRIEVRDDAVAGVVLRDGEEIAARAVLSTANPADTLLDWVDPVWLDPEFLLAVRNIRHRGSTAFVLYALDELPDFPGLSKEALAGIVSLTRSVREIEQAADAAKFGMVSEHPHVELWAPTLHWPDLAPGRHVIVARAQHAPYRLRDGAEWNGAAREDLANRVTTAIEGAAPTFSTRVLHRTVLTPRDLEERFGLREGAFSQGELGLDQILFMRPIAGWGNHATPIAGLFLGGAGTHPGPGIVGGAGWLAARQLLSDPRRRNQ